jgi:hypothetical protein
LNTYGSNLKFRLVGMSDVEFFYLKGVLIQNFNIVDLVRTFLKKSKTFTFKS